MLYTDIWGHSEVYQILCVTNFSKLMILKAEQTLNINVGCDAKYMMRFLISIYFSVLL